MKKHKDQIIIIFMCLLCIAPILLIGLYNRPSADDFDMTYLTGDIVKNGGNVGALIKAAFDTDVHFCNTWQAIYSTAFFMSLSPHIFGESYYALVPWFIFAIIVLCIYVSIRMIVCTLDISFSKIHTLALTAVAVTYIICQMPSLTQGMYWYAGAFNYIPTTMLITVNLSIVQWLLSDKERSKHVNVIVIITSMLISFFISGGNTVSAFANILCLVGCLALYWKKRKKLLVLLPLTTSVGGFLLSYFAPGTAMRQAALHQAGVIETLYNAGSAALRSGLQWITLPLIMLMLSAIPLFDEISKNVKKKITFIHVLVSVFLSWVLVSADFSVLYYATSALGNGRSINSIWITFSIAFVLCMGFLYVYIKQNFENIKIGGVRMIFVVILAIASFFFTPTISMERSNSERALQEICDGRAKAFGTEMDARVVLFRNSELTEVQAEPLSEQARSSVLYFADFGPDPNEWPNTSISSYYGKSISLKH